MNILERIVHDKFAEVAAAKEKLPLGALEKLALDRVPALSLSTFLKDPSKTGIIAEFKRQSPSKGVINGVVLPEMVTAGYEAAGASACSILTDGPYFGGSLEDLQKARKVLNIPILRKEFIIDEYQIIEARAYGADVILLIAACLSPQRLKQLAGLVRDLGMEIILEVHDREELEANLIEEVQVIGVNNRNLKTFEVSIQHSLDLLPFIPSQYLKISESGLDHIDRLNELKRAGFDGFLIGEQFMKQADPGAAMKSFVEGLV